MRYVTKWRKMVIAMVYQHDAGVDVDVSETGSGWTAIGGRVAMGGFNTPWDALLAHKKEAESYE